MSGIPGGGGGGGPGGDGTPLYGGGGNGTADSIIDVKVYRSRRLWWCSIYRRQ